MIKFTYCFVAVALLATAFALPLEELEYDPEEVYDIESPAAEIAYELHRIRRSLQPGAPSFPVPGQQNNGGWAVSPNLEKDARGNTRTSIDVQHKGKDHDFNAGWSKVIRGQDRAKPTFHVRGTYRW